MMEARKPPSILNTWCKVSGEEPRHEGLGVLDGSAGSTFDDVVDQQGEADLAVLLLDPARVDDHALGVAPECVLRLREGRLRRIDDRLLWCGGQLGDFLEVGPGLDHILDLDGLLEIEPDRLEMAEHDGLP